jgi:hypothetical protein
MRVIHTALSSHLYEKGYWPQDPATESEDEIINEEWWINTLKDYGAPPSAWLCPAILKSVETDQNGMPRKLHYTPSEFDSRMFSPFYYPNQPWLIEIASVHVNGPNVCFPDGSIRGIYDIAPNLKNLQP